MARQGQLLLGNLNAMFRDLYVSELHNVVYAQRWYDFMEHVLPTVISEAELGGMWKVFLPYIQSLSPQPENQNVHVPENGTCTQVPFH